MQAEPTRKECENWYRWAEEVAWGFAKSRDWMLELRSAGVIRLNKTWQQYIHLDEKAWKNVAKRVLHNAMLRRLETEKNQSERTDSLDFQKGEGTSQASSDELEFQRDDDGECDGGVRHIEDLMDRRAEWAEFFASLTNSEKRVLLERVNNPSAISDEVAQWGGFKTGGAVRFHEMNYRLKAKSFITRHPNKKEWQRYLSDDTTGATNRPMD